MTFIQSIILGIVQGLTEFFPVSSSAHLKITRWFLGVQESGIYFDLVCHGGTLLALLFYLRKEVWEVLSSLKKIGIFTLALFPLVPAYFLMKPLRELASEPQYLGYSLMATGMLLFLASKKNANVHVHGVLGDEFAFTLRDVVCIGIVQTIALIPGISRSGSTISAARLLGWPWLEAAKFSFLLAIPTILGGELLETLKGVGKEGGELPLACYGAGFFAAFAVGLLGVRLIFWVYKKGNVRPFAWYCLGLGLFAWTIFRA